MVEEAETPTGDNGGRHEIDSKGVYSFTEEPIAISAGSACFDQIGANQRFLRCTTQKTSSNGPCLSLPPMARHMKRVSSGLSSASPIPIPWYLTRPSEPGCAPLNLAAQDPPSVQFQSEIAHPNIYRDGAFHFHFRYLVSITSFCRQGLHVDPPKSRPSAPRIHRRSATQLEACTRGRAGTLRIPRRTLCVAVPDRNITSLFCDGG